MYVGHKVTELQIVWSLCHLIKSGPWIMSPVCLCRSKVLNYTWNSWTIFYWALGNIICLSLRQRQIKCINHKSGINWKSVSAQIVDFGTVLQGVSVARQVCACVWGVQLSGINEPALGEGLLLYNEAYLLLFFVFVTKRLYDSALYDSYMIMIITCAGGTTRDPDSRSAIFAPRFDEPLFSSST